MSGLVSPHVAPEVNRVLHRIAVGIVGEVGEDIESVDQVPLDLSGLDRQGLVRIAPTIVVFPP